MTRPRPGRPPATDPAPDTDAHVRIAGEFTVTTVTGNQLDVGSPEAKAQYERSQAEYLKRAEFPEHSDRVDLERVLGEELRLSRYQQWEMNGGRRDDGGETVSLSDLNRWIKDLGASINATKASMGLNKAQRDKNKDQGDFGAEWQRLVDYARIHGILREDQVREAIVVMKAMTSVVGAWLRSDEEERAKLSQDEWSLRTAEDVLAYIDEALRPRFDAVDEYFRDNPLRMWKQENPNAFRTAK